MTDIKMLPLYAELQGHPKLEIVKHYARANVEHHTAAKDAEIERLRSEVERLAEALRGVLPFVVSDVLEHCDGNKCREQWCAGCMGDDYAAEQVERARAAEQAARAALREHDQEVGNG